MCGDTEISTDTYSIELQKLKDTVDPGTGMTGLATQFNTLSQITPNPNQIIKDCAESNLDKNRSKTYLPCEINL